MAPNPPRRPIAKESLVSLFPKLKPQVYHDPASRGPGKHSIQTIAWNPTGYLIATGSEDRTLRIWNPDKPQVKNSTELRGHTGAIKQVAWNPTKEAELASVSADSTCRFWDVRSKTCIANIQLPGAGLTLAWAGDGSVAMVGLENDHLIPITLAPTPVAGDAHPQPIQTNQCTFNHSSPPTHLLLTRGDGSVTIASYPSLTPLHSVHAHTSSCVCLALAPSGRYLAIGGTDALISLYDTYDWVCKRTITSAMGTVRSVSCSFDGSFIVGGSDDGAHLEVVHVESGEVVGSFDTAGSGGGVVAWHPGRYWIAWAGEGAGLRILGPAGGQL